MSVSLTAQEREICNYLLRFIRETGTNVQCRIAGGWVRDKLLGLQSNDIDFALDTMTGHEFAKRLCEWEDKNVKENNTSTTDNTEGSSAKCKVGFIASNPAKSKHLETATIKLLGMDLDFVNLRTETYADDNDPNNAGNATTTTTGGGRIPVSVNFGSPLQDALRRDLTINSLFYNIHSEQVEDWTGMGLRDLLETRVARTPLDPVETFLDDPLRVLRVLRFATRLEFRLADNIMPAIRENHNVRVALARKVSRERVGIEIEKLFKTRNPWIGLDYLKKARIYSLVFEGTAANTEMRWMPIVKVGEDEKPLLDATSKTGVDQNAVDQDESVDETLSRSEDQIDHIIQQIQQIHSAIKQQQQQQSDFIFSFPNLESKHLFTLFCVLPYYGWEYDSSSGKKKKNFVPVASHIVGHSLKWPNRDRKLISFVLAEGIPHARLLALDYDRCLFDAAGCEHHPVKREKVDLEDVKGSDMAMSRGRLGMTLRKLGPLWSDIFTLAALYDCLLTNKENKLDNVNLNKEDETLTRNWTIQCSRYSRLISRINSESFFPSTNSNDVNDSMEPWNIKPIIKGDELISKSFGVPSKEIGNALDLVLYHQLDNPSASRQDIEAIIRLKYNLHPQGNSNNADMAVKASTE